MQEKTRVYALARAECRKQRFARLCRQAGIDVKNQLSSLDPEQRDAVLVLLKKGTSGGAGRCSEYRFASKARAGRPRSFPSIQTPVRNLNPAAAATRSRIQARP